MRRSGKRPEVDIKKTKIDELFHRFLNHPGVFEKLQEAHSLALRGVNPLGERQTKKEKELDDNHEEEKKSPRPPSPGGRYKPADFKNLNILQILSSITIVEIFRDCPDFSTIVILSKK